jgi:hypothetical protein
MIVIIIDRKDWLHRTGISSLSLRRRRLCWQWIGSFVEVEMSRRLLAGISVPGVFRNDEDLSELIRNPPCSIFVLMPRIVKRMDQRQPEFSARLAVDRRPESRALRRGLSTDDGPQGTVGLAAEGDRRPNALA